MIKRKRRENRTDDWKCNRELKSVWYSDSTKLDRKLERFIKITVLPHIKFRGYKHHQKHKIAVNTIASLWFAEKRTMAIKDSRDNSQNALRIGVWDALEDAGFVNRGTGSKLSGYITYYRSSRLLVQMMNKYDPNKPLLDYNLQKNTTRKRPTRHAYLVVQTGKRDIKTGKLRPKCERGKPLPLNTYSACVRNYLEQLENRVEAVVKNQLCHSYKPDINPCVKYVYSEVLGRYAMLHGWSILSFQGFSKEERKEITIDGEPTVELDFSGYFLRQFYHFRGIEPVGGDIYQPKKILNCYSDLSPKDKKLMRNLVKKTTVFCLNNPTFNKAYFVAKGMIQPTKKELKRKNDKYVQKKLKQKKRIKYLLSQIENISLYGMMQKIVKLHTPIKDDLFKPELYAHTMSISTTVLLETLEVFTKKGKAILPIHDSIIIKKSDEKLAKNTMIKKYQKYHPKNSNSGFTPVIKSIKKTNFATL